MEIIDFRFQVALFGNFDDISPNVDVIKYFIEVFADRGLIPSQFNELSFDIAGGAGKNANRLSLTSKDSSWNIRFSHDRADFVLTNIDIGKFSMLSKADFLSDFNEIHARINEKFPKKIKRLGFVNQYLITGIPIDDVSKKISRTPEIMTDTPSIEFSNKVATRTTIKVPEEEIMNISGELRWLRTNMKIENQDKIFDGLLMTIDINTLGEKTEYRIDADKIKNILAESTTIEDSVREGYLKLLQ